MSWPSEWQRQLFLLMCFMSSCDRFRKECFHFICSPMLLHHVTLVSLRLLRKNLDNLWEFLDKWFTNAPLHPSKKLPCGCNKFKYQPWEFLCTVFLHFSMLTILRMFLQDTILDYWTRMHLWCESLILLSELLIVNY